MGIKFLVVEMD